MKTFECIARSGKTGKQLVFLIRAHDRGEAQSFALKQARAQFGSNAGAVVIDSTKEIG